MRGISGAAPAAGRCAALDEVLRGYLQLHGGASRHAGEPLPELDLHAPSLPNARFRSPPSRPYDGELARQQRLAGSGGG